MSLTITLGFISVAVVAGADTCESGIRWHPGIQVH